MTREKGAKNADLTIVLTPGRSGSSLLMEVLNRLGLTISVDTIPPRLENPHGFFEDRAVVEIHRRLQAELGAVPGFPLPEGWLQVDATRRARSELKDHLLQEVSKGGPHGTAIKDPRIPEFLPMWVKTLNRTQILPRFILALRNPASVATSQGNLMGRRRDLVELQWLSRTLSSIEFTGADLFIVHYEDWFDKPLETIAGLADFCQLPRQSQDELLRIIDATLDVNLDHASWKTQEISNPLTDQLYRVLRGSRGSDFDRGPLLAEVRRVSRIFDSFSVWSDEASEKSRQAPHLEKQLMDTQNQFEAEKTRLMQELQAATDELSGMSRQAHHLEKQLMDTQNQFEAEKTRLMQELQAATDEASRHLTATTDAITANLELRVLVQTHRESALASEEAVRDFAERLEASESKLYEVVNERQRTDSLLSHSQEEVESLQTALTHQASQIAEQLDLLQQIFDSKVWKVASIWRRLR